MHELLSNLYNFFSLANNTCTLSHATYTATTGCVIAAGTRQVIIITNADFAGTIMGTAGTASTTYRWDAPLGTRFPSITITCSAGVYTVLTVI